MNYFIILYIRGLKKRYRIMLHCYTIKSQERHLLVLYYYLIPNFSTSTPHYKHSSVLVSGYRIARTKKGFFSRGDSHPFRRFVPICTALWKKGGLSCGSPGLKESIRLSFYRAFGLYLSLFLPYYIIFFIRFYWLQ